MDKQEQAQRFAEILLSEKGVTYEPSNLARTAWQYADAMQSEADKRKVGGIPEAILNMANPSQLKPDVIEQILHDIYNYFDSHASNSLRDANNVIQEIYESLSGEKKVEDWQPDWSQAPDNCHFFCVASNGGYGFFNNIKPELMGDYFYVGCGALMIKDHGYQGNWQDSLRKRPQ